MDPISVIGLIASAGQLIDLCFKVTEGLHSLHGKHSRAGDSLVATRRECTTLCAGVKSIKTWAETVAAKVDSRREQCASLDEALLSLIPSIQVLADEVDNILTRNTKSDGSVSAVGKLKYLWRDDEIRSHLEEMRWMSQHIQFLIMTMSLPGSQAAFEIQRLNDVASVHYSLDDDVPSMISATEFVFDHQIINTMVYKRAFLATMRTTSGVVAGPDKPTSNETSNSDQAIKEKEPDPEQIQGPNHSASPDRGPESDQAQTPTLAHHTGVPEHDYHQGFQVFDSQSIPDDTPNTLSPMKALGRIRSPPIRVPMALNGPTHSAPVSRKPWQLSPSPLPKETRSPPRGSSERMHGKRPSQSLLPTCLFIPPSHSPKPDTKGPRRENIIQAMPMPISMPMTLPLPLPPPMPMPNILGFSNDHDRVMTGIGRQYNDKAKQLYESKEFSKAMKVWEDSLRYLRKSTIGADRDCRLEREICVNIATANAESDSFSTVFVQVQIEAIFGIPPLRLETPGHFRYRSLAKSLNTRAHQYFSERLYDSALDTFNVLLLLLEKNGSYIWRSLSESFTVHTVNASRAHCYFRLGNQDEYDVLSSELAKSDVFVLENLENDIFRRLLEQIDKATHEEEDLNLLEVTIRRLTIQPRVGDDRLEAQIAHAFVTCEDWERGLEAIDILSRGAELTCSSRLLFQKAFIHFKSDRLEEAKQCCWRSMTQLRPPHSLWSLYLDYVALIGLIYRHEEEVTIADEYAKMLPTGYWQSSTFRGGMLHSSLCSPVRREFRLRDQDPASGEALLFAVTHSKSAVAYCVESGAETNHRGLDGCTALCIAVESGKFEEVNELLRSKEIDVNLSSHGETALFIAIRRKDAAMISLLLGSGADPFADTLEQPSPLAKSCLDGVLKLSELLLACGMDIDTTDNKRGWTMLHYAVYGKTEAMVQMLRDRGADENVKGRDLQTPKSLRRRARK